MITVYRPAPTDTRAHLTDSYTGTPSWWEYLYPNGRGVNVIASRIDPFRFFVEVEDAPHYGDTMRTQDGLTTEQVEQLLADVAAMPPAAGDPQ